MTKEEIVQNIKEQATAIAKKHTKAMLLEMNAVVGPLALDLAAEAIPGQIDNAIIEGAKPLVKSALDSGIEQAFA